MTAEGQIANDKEDPVDLRTVIDSTPGLIHTGQPDGYLDFFNQTWLRYVGKPLEYLLGWKWTTFIHGDDVEGIVGKWRASLASGEPFLYEARVRRADGEYRWMLHHKVALRSQQGDIVKWYGSSIDIEDRKQAEERLRRSTQELERGEFYLAEGQRLAHIGSWAFSAAGFDYWSPELFRIHGLDPARKAPSVQEYLDLIHPQDRESMANLITGILGKASPFDATKRIVRPNGEVRYVRCVGAPVGENQDGLKEYVGSAIDVTEHELLTQELRRREAYLAEAQRLSHTGSFGWRPDSGEIFWSEETYRIFEYDPALKPTINSIVQSLHPEDRPDFLRVIESASAGATQFEHTYRWLLLDGSVKHVHALAHALQDASGNREFVGAVTDVTAAKQAEEKLRQSEAELRQVVDVIPQQVFVFDEDWSPLFANRRELEYTGLTSQEMHSKDAGARIFHPEDLKKLEAARARAHSDGAPFEVEARIRGKDGGYRWFLIRDNPLRDGQGRVLRWYGTRTDIEDRKRVEEALRGNEAYLAEAQRLSQTGSWAWSPVSDTTYYSEECYRLLGFEPLGPPPPLETVIQQIHPDDQAYCRERVENGIRDKLDFELDYRIVHPDKKVRDIHCVCHPILDGSGDLVELVGTIIDITERKAAEEKIREQEMELRQMLDLAPQQVAVFGPGGERLYANRVALDYVGLGLEEWRQTPGGPSRPGWFIHSDDRERAARAYSDGTRSGGSAYEMELRVQGADGSYRWFLLRYNPVHDEHGQIKRWYVAATDIDERKRAEERLQQENVALREEVDKASMFEEIVGASAALRTVLSSIAKVAPTDSTVLIGGETGTGKELVARAIHRRSHRSREVFVSVNCAAIPRDLIASELFGHEKGAFTGATQRRLGRFEMAEGGTIFLDEVGELPAETQIALLRVLQEREFERVGGGRLIPSNVRVIAATNRDLQAAIAAGSFRSDLFYRLNVFPIEIPPLRQRKEDIALLVEYFVDRYARKIGKKIRHVSKKTLDLLQSYPWPGNIRELQNVIERSVIVSETEIFSIDESWLSRGPTASPAKGSLDLVDKLAAQEKEMIEAALKESGGRVYGPSGAAAKLGMARSTLESKIRSLRINKNRFKS
jgi:PAS domain S-box-containing protein